MRIIVFGIGAIGGTVAAALALAGREVVGIARGAQLRAITDGGLTLRTPDATHRVALRCVGSPAEIAFRPDDAILLAMKTQDTAAALDQLVAAGVSAQPVFCMQNGVENERLALRHFANVHGITVIMPADYVTAGEIAAFGAPKLGIFDIGRFPAGADRADENLAAALDAAGIASFVDPEVMRGKYGKLLMNLGNIVEAAYGAAPATRPIRDRLRAEALAVFAAAGIAHREVIADPRRDALMQMRSVPGVSRAGSSSTQSLLRGTGSIETAYLNGEISLLGRLSGVPTPANDWFGALGPRMLREGIAPGTANLQEAEAALGLEPA